MRTILRIEGRLASIQTGRIQRVMRSRLWRSGFAVGTIKEVE